MVSLKGEGGEKEVTNNGVSSTITPVRLHVPEADATRSPRQGTKLSPICIDEGMKRQATPSEELQKLCFPATFSNLDLLPGMTNASHSSRSTSNSKNSTGSKKSNNHNHNNNNCSSLEGDMDAVLAKLMEKSVEINSAMAERTTSRHGRSTQRWIVDPNSAKVTRLVTGCVPILLGGKIMLVSAGKRKEWILPKGGWETDEEIYESAIREAFEEAGVLGILGPKLSEVEYETKKARQRRLALEEKLKNKPETNGQFSSGWSDVSQLSEDEHLITSDKQSSTKLLTAGNKMDRSQSEEGSDKDKEIKYQTAANDDMDLEEKASGDSPKQSEGGSTTGTSVTDGRDISDSPLLYSHVCVSLFPLYVKEVMTTWPESGRLRKAVEIDEAIELLVARPEMQSMLREVKARGLHRV